MGKTGKIIWRSSSNIALVKYWGKRNDQIPANPSVSMSLTKCFTETAIEYFQESNLSGPSFSFLFEGKQNERFAENLKRYISAVQQAYPQIADLHLNIESKNSFPYSAGIASSASSFSSFALCLSSILHELSGRKEDEHTFSRRASSLARLGSGSACRSVYEGWTMWGRLKGVTGSSDNYAIPVNGMIHEKFRIYYDAILIVDSGKKSVSSTSGHEMMKTNPYNKVRAVTGKSNALNLLNALKEGNEDVLCRIVESEAAGLHAMMLTSDPGFILVKPETLQIINKLADYRKSRGLVFSITLDAGPNIHLLYPEKSREKILSFISSELVQHCENGRWIDDIIGGRPQQINT